MGAVFSGGGAVVSYDDGIQAAASGATGTGGTQRNEFAAAIKSVTSSATVGAVFLYSTKDDSDGGAWRKKCKGLSWFDEASSATRSARSEFPAMALIVVDNVSSAATVSIYDLDDVAAPLWLKLNAGTSSLIGAASAVYSSVTMLNGVMVLGRSTNGVYVLDFASESATFYNNSNGKYVYGGGFVNRNGSVTYQSLGTSAGQIANDAVNDVAATVLEGAEIGALGLPIPTVAVATAGGVSVIHPNGSVYDLKDSTSANRSYSDVRFRDDGGIFSWSSMNGTAHSWYPSSIYSDRANNPDFKYDEYDNTHLPNVLANTPQTIAVANDSVFTGGDNGLSIIKENLANPAEGMAAHITSTYNTGYMVGDIRFAGLAGNGTANEEREDRSVKGNDLAETGTIDSAVVATSAELYGYSGFTTNDYLSRSDTDLGTTLDFGTGDFSIMFWVKFSSYSGTQRICGRADSTTSHRLSVYVDTSYIYFYTTNGSSYYAYATNPTADEWTQVVMTRRSNALKVYLNGSDQTSTSGSAIAVDLTCTSASPLMVGAESFDQGSTIDNPATNGSLSLLRISATAPTPAQIKAIYDAEKPLFAANAKCLLQSDSVGAPNSINALAYDKSTGLLNVFQQGDTIGDTRFRGLEAVESYGGKSDGWNYSSSASGAAAGGVITQARTTGTGGVLVDLPALDVRAELNEGEDKLPDDGKLHFEGVTNDGGSTTPVTIGQIPVAEGECVTVTAKVRGNEYNDVDGEYCYYEVSHSFYRDTGDNLDSPTSTLGDVIAKTATITVSDESTATMAFVLEPAAVSGGPVATTDIPNKKRTVILKCTGVANKRMQWKASVEVQRISDKTYER